MGKTLSSAGGKALTLAQLRQLTPAQLDAQVDKMPNPAGLSGAPPLRFAPSIDGLVLPDAATLDRNTNDTPILTGMTANEGTGMNPNYGKTTAAWFADHLKTSYGPLAPRFATLYPAKSDTESATAFDALARDRGLASMYFWARDRVQHTRFPVYAYLWTHPEPGPEALRYKAFHSSEIPYVFETLDTAERPFTPEDRALAALMSSYWVNFVTSGNPNGDRMPSWPKFTALDKQILEVGLHTTPRAVLTSSQIALFAQFTQSGGRLGLF